ncbi:MAG: organic hydroperoxide reductase OsmC/OhrA [Arenicella sp.]|jgi:organic hydroperoxide reductase OsmC/OhrA
MTALSVILDWQRQEPVLSTGKYSCAHTVQYNEHYSVRADAAPDWGGNLENTNPEQALAAAMSSCHMMTFLALAAKAKWPVSSYTDKAEAFLGKNPKGQMSISRIDLNPVVEFDEGFEISASDVRKMQDRAHRYCFVANTLAESVAFNIN